MKRRAISTERLGSSLLLTAAICVLLPFDLSHAADASALLTAYDQIYHAKLEDSIRRIKGLTLAHQNLELNLDSGEIVFLAPVVIDSCERYFGAYFEGAARMRFVPPVAMEREQLRRFFGADSLDRSFTEALLLFADEATARLLAGSGPMAGPVGDRRRKRARQRLEDLTREETHYFTFELLRNLNRESEQPFFLLNVEPRKTNRVFYLYNPGDREEVSLWRHHHKPGESFMELISSYSAEIDTGYARINGQSKAAVEILRYDIDAALSNHGNLTATATLTLRVRADSLQLLPLSLHSRLRVDEISDSAGGSVPFLRWEDEDNRSRGLYVIFDRKLRAGENLTFDFTYEGEIAREIVGLFYVTAGAQWYPAYEPRRRARFNLRFRTPAEYEFVATGRQTERRVSADTLITHWRVERPARNVSFSIGPMKKHEFRDPETAPVDIYFSEDLHYDLAGMYLRQALPIGKHVEERVAGDVIGALKLFTHNFGPYPHDRLSVSEILAYHGEAFPGFLHMGLPTWLDTDLWGYQKVFRAHEVAHQWWGVGVGFETYHDQWLSEAFAEYSALLYLQKSEGNDRFFARLRDYRDEIFSVRKYVLGSGDEAGPIALGYRTTSSRTEGDYGLVVYKKGALVLHMLRNLMLDLSSLDDSAFFNMMREFYATYRGRDATTQDFQEIAEKYAGADLSWFFAQWVYGADLPTYKFRYRLDQESDETFTATCTVEVKDVPPHFKMYLPVEVELDKKQRAYLRVRVDGPQHEFKIPGLPKKPKKIRLNPFESVLAKVKQ